MATVRGLSRRLLALYGFSIFTTCLFILPRRTPEDPRILELTVALNQLKEVEAQEILRRDQLMAICSELESIRYFDKSLTHLCYGEASAIEPYVFHRLPHMKGNSSDFRPILLHGSNRTGVWMVMGLSTVKRNKSFYLVNTVGSLIENLKDEDKSNCLIVVLISELHDRMLFVKEIMDGFKTYFQEHLDSGLLEVVLVPSGFYPNFNSLVPTFNDTKQRAIWRTKQNLDYIYLMMYCLGRGSYYLQLEDDIAASPDYSSKMRKHMATRGRDWSVLEFSQMGFIGKLFNKNSLAMMVEFLVMFFDDKPCDWLLDHFLELRSDCDPLLGPCKTHRQIIKPSLFQHLGTHSSLTGKTQRIKAKDFVGETNFVPRTRRTNPPAVIDTSLKKYSTFTLQEIYDYHSFEENFFYWSYNPAEQDYVVIRFTEPVAIDWYLIQSGTPAHAMDTFRSVVLEVKPLKLSRKNETENQYIMVDSINNSSLSVSGKQGTFEGRLQQSLGPIEELRLRFLTDSQYWLAIPEISLTTFNVSSSWFNSTTR